MMDVDERRLSLKQKESCKNYLLKLGGNSTQLPNIADIFDLWPYIMYYNETKNAHTKDGMIEFVYSYPLGEKKAKDSDIIVYFDKETMELKQFVIRANSLNITNQIVIHAVQPITPVYFEENDLEYKDLNCTQGTEFE
jgi:outer membrane lipoprotein-sorting protein